ncbi:DUF6528 family protein [Paenibacillus sp. GYB003]|uniref:DUF6528 family protein n=1 Tax=Paenibacillus sp. GYB003 TaxID=2994392 RepID=UPI002F96C408
MMKAETGRRLHEYGIAVTDQAAERISVYDPMINDWNESGAILWSWAPSGTNGFAELLHGWGLPSDVKLREGRAGGTYMVVTDSRGLAAIVPYPSGDRRTWGAIVGGNPHAAELLPDGNIAVAASAGGWVRVYAASQGPDAADYAEYSLPGAHGVLWDPRLRLLWAVGDYDLIALKVVGTAESPVLEEVRRSRLPTDWGHDLFAVYGNTDKLWITTHSHVYQYDKSGDRWSLSYEGASGIDGRGVKSIGNQPSGLVVKTSQKAGTKYAWTTDTVDMHVPNDRRTVAGGAFYKARVWCSDYQ